jgi:DNA-binding CsgD family transcriptional regulator
MESLTARQIEVSRLIATGLSNKQIGKRLKISEQTVKNHTYAIYRKLTVNNRVELTIRFHCVYSRNWNWHWRKRARNGGRAGTGSARRHPA